MRRTTRKILSLLLVVCLAPTTILMTAEAATITLGDLHILGGGGGALTGAGGAGGGNLAGKGEDSSGTQGAGGGAYVGDGAGQAGNGGALTPGSGGWGYALPAWSTEATANGGADYNSPGVEGNGGNAAYNIAAGTDLIADNIIVATGHDGTGGGGSGGGARLDVGDTLTANSISFTQNSGTLGQVVGTIGALNLTGRDVTVTVTNPPLGGITFNQLIVTPNTTGILRINTINGGGSPMIQLASGGAVDDGIVIIVNNPQEVQLPTGYDDTVVYDDGYSTSAVQLTQVVSIGATLVAPGNLFTRTGWTFTGWLRNTDSVPRNPGAVVNAADATAGTTLVARWSQNNANPNPAGEPVDYNLRLRWATPFAGGIGLISADVVPSGQEIGADFRLISNDESGWTIMTDGQTATKNGLTFIARPRDAAKPGERMIDVTGAFVGSSFDLHAQATIVSALKKAKLNMGVTITTETLPDGVIGMAYSADLAATGTTPITWTITSGDLPGGLTLNTDTGAVSGTPTTVGSFTFTVKAENSMGSDEKEFTVTIAASGLPVITTTTPLPNVLFDQAYSTTLAAMGTRPITWTVKSGDLPSGLALNTATGTLSGTTKADVGTYTFSVTATNIMGSDEKEFSLEVKGAFALADIADALGCGGNTGVGTAAMFFVSLGVILAPRFRRRG